MYIYDVCMYKFYLMCVFQFRFFDIHLSLAFIVSICPVFLSSHQSDLSPLSFSPLSLVSFSRTHTLTLCLFPLSFSSHTANDFTSRSTPHRFCSPRLLPSSHCSMNSATNCAHFAFIRYMLQPFVLFLSFSRTHSLTHTYTLSLMCSLSHTHTLSLSSFPFYLAVLHLL